MPNRRDLIEMLTQYELQNLLDNPELFEETARFFFHGGFNVWETEALHKKYELFIKEETHA